MTLESVEGMYEGIQYLGEKYNRMEQADELVKDFEEKLTEIEAKIEGKESPKVLILLGVPGSYLVATEESYVGDLVRRAGGINAMKETDVEYICSKYRELAASRRGYYYCGWLMGCQKKSLKCLIKNLKKMIYGNILKQSKMTEFMI